MLRTFLLMAACLLANAATDAEALFRDVVRPTIQQDCEGCHGAQMAMSKLDLRTRESMLKGGTRGAVVEPGQPERSLLLNMISGQHKIQMPPAKKLSPEVVAAFRDWIAAGAPFATGEAKERWTYKPEDLWAFRPLPKLAAGASSGASIDSFLAAKLPGDPKLVAPRADRVTLLRRATIDLTGLLPTPAETKAFVEDKRPDAWLRVVDRLLASPHYGERQARRWLDVVRYADSSGYSNDFERPNAWRYRDYVIRAFQQDKPYDQFVREQIAGDELYPDSADAQLATGFLRAGPWEHTAMSVEAQTRQLFLDDVTHATAATFLGLTMGCARCHDHKFDPLPTKDYYRLQAVFASTEFARTPLPFQKDENAGNAAARARLQAVADRNQQQYAAMKKNAKDLPPNEAEELKVYQKHAQIYQEALLRYEPLAFRVSSGPLDGLTDGGSSLKYPKRDSYQAAAVHILPGGNLQSPAERVTPGVPTALEKFGGYKALEIPEAVSGRRAALAQWIAHPSNPLTARVMVNRLWQDHFGRGLASDTSNFGRSGGKPTHPELLDWLAGRFVESGWSLKAMHRLMLKSEAYQRSSEAPKADLDPALLAYYPPRRMEAEVLRDALLQVSGELNREAGGPGVFAEINEEVARQPRHAMGSLMPAYQPSFQRAERNRRTIYTFQQRGLADPMLEVFNAPGADLSCERREASTVAPQAFTLFNGQFTHDRALAFAARLVQQHKSPRQQLEQAFLQALGRVPAAEEMKLALQHLQQPVSPAVPRAVRPPVVHKITSELTGESFAFTQRLDWNGYEENLHPSEVSPAVRALASLALVLFNGNEFAYVY
jgi:cytochrome c553